MHLLHMDILATLASFLVGLAMAVAGYLGLKKRSTRSTATTSSATAMTAVTPAATPDDYKNTGDLIVDGIYTHYAEGDTGATRPYDNVDPDQYPEVWVRLTGVKEGKVLTALRVDGRSPADSSEIKVVDVGGFIGGHGIAVLPYPEYTAYRAAGIHEVVVMVGRVKDGEDDAMAVEWMKSYPFDVTVKKVT